jgi:hypothetical protein
MAVWKDACNALDFAYRGYQYPLPPSWKYAVRLEDQIQWLLQAILKLADESLGDEDLDRLYRSLKEYIDDKAGKLQKELNELSAGGGYSVSPTDGFKRSGTVTARQLFDASRPFGMTYAGLAAAVKTYDEVKAKGKTYDQVDFFATLWFGDGSMTAHRTPAADISESWFGGGRNGTA